MEQHFVGTSVNLKAGGIVGRIVRNFETVP